MSVGTPGENCEGRPGYLVRMIPGTAGSAHVSNLFFGARVRDGMRVDSRTMAINFRGARAVIPSISGGGAPTRLAAAGGGRLASTVICEI